LKINIGEDKKIKKYIIFKKDRIKNTLMQTLWRSRMDYKTACRSGARNTIPNILFLHGLESKLSDPKKEPSFEPMARGDHRHHHKSNPM
jgi:hypothetical protein